MAEYIEREAAVKIVEKYSLANGSVLGRHSGLADCITSEIAALPAADIAPVVHGRWIQVDSTKCRCSHCDIIALIALYPHGDKNFCPNCGAKMDGGADNA